MDRGLFKRAIADNEEPTSGYMYREMAQWTFKDYSAQMKFIGALLEKLEPNTSVHVLYKVLRIIKIMCETGHSDFQKEMQKNGRTEEIKAFTTYRGKPDAKHGDSLNEKVRHAARDAMEAVFAHQREGRLTLETVGYGGNGGNSNSYSGGAAVGQSTFTTGYAVTGAILSEPMGVHGNRIAPMPVTNKWAEHIAQQASTANASITSRMISTLTEKAKKGFGVLGNTDAIGQFKSARDELFENALRLSTTGVNTGSSFSLDSGGFKPPEMKGVAIYSSGDEGRSSEWKFIEDSASGVDSSLRQRRDGSFTTQQSQEQERVTPFQASVRRICQMKSTPQRVELHAFVSQCLLIGEQMMQQRVGAVLDDRERQDFWEELAEALDTQLAQQHPWQRRLNALVAIEALIHPRSCDAHLDNAGAAIMRQAVARYFFENPEDVQRNVSVIQSTLRDRAERVLKLLGLPGSDNKNTITADSVGAGATGTAVVTTGGGVLGVGESTTDRDAVVDMSGMALRVGHRGMKDKTALKKRVPMRFVDNNVVGASGVNENNSRCGERENVKMMSTSGSGNISFENAITGNINSNNRNNNTCNLVGGNNVLDDLFGALAIPTSTRTTPTESGEYVSTVFDFLKVGGVEAPNSFGVPLSRPSTSNETSATAGFLLPSTDVKDRNIAIDNNKNKNTILFVNDLDAFPTPPSLSPTTTTTTTTNTTTIAASDNTSAPTFGVPSSSVLLEMQQQLQVLMSSLKNSQNPDSLGQIQSIFENQQHLMSLVSQQQQPVLWDTSSSNSVSGSGGIAPPVHNRFSMGIAPSSFSSASSASCTTRASNTFAGIQREMMSYMAISKQE